MSEVQDGAAASEAVDTAAQDQASQAAKAAGAATEIPGGANVDPASIPEAPAGDAGHSHGVNDPGHSHGLVDGSAGADAGVVVGDGAGAADVTGEGADPADEAAGAADESELGNLRAKLSAVKAELNAILTGIRTRAHNGEAHLVSLIERL